jgi:hypothetical protein
MGTIIGRQGLKIKQIQDYSGVRMVAQKEMLPQSTERIDMAQFSTILPSVSNPVVVPSAMEWVDHIIALVMVQTLVITLPTTTAEAKENQFIGTHLQPIPKMAKRLSHKTSVYLPIWLDVSLAVAV